MKFLTEQEEFWAKNFGDSYIKRNNFSDLLPQRINLFSEIIQNTSSIKNIIEFGPNTGANLAAIKSLIPKVELSAVEINPKAVKQINKLKICKKVWHDSILKFNSKKFFDLSFTSGVLIHINPEYLNLAYEKLYKSSRKYILMIEYYNPTPLEMNYRGHKKKLFKRDFAGDMISKYKDIKLLNYGFKYKLDNNFPHDDVTWFLLKKEEA